MPVAMPDGGGYNPGPPPMFNPYANLDTSRIGDAGWSQAYSFSPIPGQLDGYSPGGWDAFTSATGGGSDSLSGVDAATNSENAFINNYSYGPGNMPPAGTGGSAPPAGSSSSSRSSGPASGYDPQNPLTFPIYIGYREKHLHPPHMTTGDPEFDNYQTQTQVRQTTVGDLLHKFDSMTIAEQHDWYRNLLIAGYLPGSRSAQIDPLEVDAEVKASTANDAREAYTKLLMATWDLQQNQSQKVTPADVLKTSMAYRLHALGLKWDGNTGAFNDGFLAYLKAAGIDTSSVSSGSGPSAPVKLKPYSETSTARSVDFMNPADAKALTRGMLQQELGRDPTKAEYEDFLAAINSAERHNPSSRTTTSNFGYDANGHFRELSSHSTTHSGISGAGLTELMREKAQQSPGWAEWQAMGTYFPALLAALGPAVPGA